MKDLSPRARALLDRARTAENADPQARHRVRRSLAASIATGSGMVTTGTAAVAAHAATLAKGSALVLVSHVKTSLLIGAVLGIGVAVPAAYFTRPDTTSNPPSSLRAPGRRIVLPRHSEPANPASGQSELSAEPEPQAMPTPAPEPESEPESEPQAIPAPKPEPQAIPVPEPQVMPEPQAIPVPEPQAMPVPEPDRKGAAPAPMRTESNGTTKLAAETQLLELAHLEQRHGRVARALELIEEHELRFPDGALREERLAAKVLVLCALGRPDEARHLAGRFERLFPRSPLLPRVRGSCAGGASRQDR